MIESVENRTQADNRKILAIHAILGILDYLKGNPGSESFLSEWISSVGMLLNSKEDHPSTRINDTRDNLKILGLMGLSGNKLTATLPLILRLASSPDSKRTLLNRIYAIRIAHLSAGELSERIAQILREHMTPLKK